MNLDLLYRLLDVPEEEGPAHLVFTARRLNHTLPYLVLSAVQLSGGRMGSASLADLERARRRVERYGRLLTEIQEGIPVTAVKGASLAGCYPAGLFRPQGDLDLVARDEADLWRAVLHVQRREPVDRIDVSILPGPRLHVFATLFWPGEDPLLDPQLRVEVSTTALVGDFVAVPAREALPEDPALANLLAIAEERLLRPFHARDVIDVLMLARTPLPPVPEVIAAAADYRLAPELAELLLYATQFGPLGDLEDVAAGLAEQAAHEHARRRSTPDGATQVRPRYGMLLRRTTGRDHWDRVRLHQLNDDTLLFTPVGDYLLVDQEVVGRDRYEAAMRALDLVEGVGA